MKDLRVLKMPLGFKENLNDETAKVNDIAFYFFKDLLNRLDTSTAHLDSSLKEIANLREQLVTQQIKYLELLKQFDEQFRSTHGN